MKKLFSIIIIFLGFLSFSNEAYSFNKKYVEKKYNRYFDQLNRAVCRGGVEEKFEELYKDFRGYGFYIPVLSNGKIDKKTIKEMLHLLRDKIRFVQTNLNYIEQQYSSKQTKMAIKRFEKALKQAIVSKSLKNFSPSEDNKKNHGRDFKNLSLEIDNLYNQIPFLLNFLFPIDFFELRKQYDQVNREKETSKKNKIYITRKILEDGAQNSEHRRSDKFLRALLSTSYIRLKQPALELSDELYYDLKDLIKSLKSHLKRSREKLKERQVEWLGRTKLIYKFYKELLENDNKEVEYLKKQKLARRRLQDYVQKYQTKTYKFWSQRPKLYRAIFATETILANEVGRLDVKENLERKLISRVVRTRTRMEEYNTPKANDSLFKKIKAAGIKSSRYPWLNVLFKKGEFSFTYYFLHASLRSFCPERTRAGRRLRSENVKIAMEIIAKNLTTEAVRYFSRASMVGRIKMDAIWDRFEKLPEMPGILLKPSDYVVQKLKQGKYLFLYQFSQDGKDFRVIELDNRRYTYDKARNRLYEYRNPYYFTYFKEKVVDQQPSKEL
ncbi:MAG: hypothetical protein ACPGJV_07165 [Bacteriovoracaceae bacterium]